MTKIIFLTLMLVFSGSAKVSDWEITNSENNYKLYYSNELKTSKWIGCPDINYSWDSDRLSYERTVKDENNKDILVKTYKDPIEIIADLKFGKVFDIDNKGGIEKAVVKKFGGSLIGFVWLDNVSGGGEVILPFTAPHIFKATGDRLDPNLVEIGTDPNEDNYYEIIKGKTRIFVKSFSGIGGAAGVPNTVGMFAHYKLWDGLMFSGSGIELVTNGDFANWTTDNPDGWTVVGESGGAIGSRDPEISQVATGHSHANAGGYSPDAG